MQKQKLTTVNLVNVFKQKHPEIKHSKELLTACLIAYNEKSFYKVIHDGYKLYVGPLGYFLLESYAVNKPKIDYHKTKVEGFICYHQEFHSGNRRYYWKWIRSRFLNGKHYQFKLVRANKRYIAKSIKEETQYKFQNKLIV